MVALIQEIIDDILAQTSHDVSQGRDLAENVIQYLEGNTAWVELYGVTGELLIPSTLEVQEGLKELFASLQQVFNNFFFMIRLAF